VELYEGEMKALISDLTEITGTLPLLHTGFEVVEESSSCSASSSSSGA